MTEKQWPRKTLRTPRTGFVPATDNPKAKLCAEWGNKI